MSKNTKTRILDASLQIIFNKGLPRFKLEDVSEYLKISRKTIYNNFISRDKLLSLVFDLYTRKFSDLLDNLKSRTDMSYIEKIEKAAIIGSEEFSKLEESAVNDDRFFRDNSIITPLNELKTKLHGWISVFLEEGLNSGFLRKDSSLGILPHYFVNLIEGASKLTASGESSISRQSYMKETLRISLRGVLTEEAAAGL